MSESPLVEPSHTNGQRLGSTSETRRTKKIILFLSASQNSQNKTVGETSVSRLYVAGCRSVRSPPPSYILVRLAEECSVTSFHPLAFCQIPTVRKGGGETRQSRVGEA